MEDIGRQFSSKDGHSKDLLIGEVITNRKIEERILCDLMIYRANYFWKDV
jgi:hypothetical protein